MKTPKMRMMCVLTLAVIAVAAQAAVPRGAFIRRPVKSVTDLIAHVKSDPVVMDRMVRHFRLTPPQITNYFSTLHLAKLANEGVYIIFNVHSDNVIRGRYFKVQKGTLVFADNSGRPILKKECGNPMVLRLPPIVAESPTTNPAGPRDAVQGDVSSSEELVVMEPGVMNVPAAPPMAPPIRPQVTGGFIAGNSGGFGFLPIFLGLGGLGMLIKKEDNDCPPVPEPATMVILAAGVGTLVAKRRKKS